MANQTQRGQWREAARQALEALGARNLTDRDLWTLESCSDEADLWQTLESRADAWGEDLDWEEALTALSALLD